jgi:hypothetical protein
MRYSQATQAVFDNCLKIILRDFLKEILIACQERIQDLCVICQTKYACLPHLISLYSFSLTFICQDVNYIMRFGSIINAL